jgi:hypothetical protein
MPTPFDSRRETVPPSTPSAVRITLVAEALTCVITGRPMPESLRAPSIGRTRPPTAEAGIAWILAGPGSGGG